MPAEGMPEFREIVGAPRSLADVVSDGHFDAVPLPDNLVMFCDSDEPEANAGYSFTIDGHYIHGDAFFVRRSEDKGYVSLTDDDVDVILSFNI
jgi:hypothetical protein